MKAEHKTQHYFFLNPYAGLACTRCPKCNAKTKVRKFPLVIHIEPHTLSVLNKVCKFCPSCELIITRRSKVQPLLAQMLKRPEREFEKKESYSVIGTLDRSDWQKVKQRNFGGSQVANRVKLFKNHWQFEITGGWRREE